MYNSPSKGKLSAFQALGLFIILTSISAFAPMASAVKNIEDLPVITEAEVRQKAEAAGICEDYLSQPHYDMSRTFMGPNFPPRVTLMPEAGSIEQLHPGTVASLVHLRMRAINLRKALPKADSYTLADLKQITSVVDRELGLINEAHADSRFHPMIQTFRQAIARTENNFDLEDYSRNVPAMLTMLENSLWELIIACFFDGTEIRINQLTSVVYQKEFIRLSGSSQDKSKLIRELDIVIRLKDGTWRWIEVKDWDVGNNSDPWRKRKLSLQSFGQDDVRHLLKLNVKLTLVLKYRMDPLDYLHLRTESAFDEVLFAFPVGVD